MEVQENEPFRDELLDAVRSLVELLQDWVGAPLGRDEVQQVAQQPVLQQARYTILSACSPFTTNQFQ